MKLASSKVFVPCWDFNNCARNYSQDDYSIPPTETLEF